MKKIVVLTLAFALVGISLTCGLGWAEETSPGAAPVVEEQTQAPAEAVETVESAAPVTPSATPSTEAATPAPVTENLEFVSGEVSAVDEAAKSVTVKLYGETENDASAKVLTVKVDETTDITDGEQDRDLKSLSAGTEVDVEYDPASNKATYIFVY